MKSFYIASVLFMCSSLAFGQYGMAPNGYYPSNYNGETFSGKVTTVDGVSERITISFANGNKTETFLGRFQEPCAVPSADGKPMTALDLPIGTDVTVFFVANARKDKDASVKEPVIIGIMFHSWDGHPVKQALKKMYLCSSAPIAHYWRYFSSAGAACIEPPSR